MKDLSEVLKELGFEDREAKIYLLLLKEGDLAALQLARLSQIDRTTIYDILEKLSNKGIVSVYLENKTKKFKALTPEKLLVYFKEKYSSLERIIPELNKITSYEKDKTTCELFTGKEGLKSVLKDLISIRKDYKVIGIKKEYEEILGYFNEQGVLKFDEFNVKEKAIVEKGTEFKKLKKGDYKYIDEKLSPVTTLIYNDTVVFFLWTEPYFAFRIINKTFRKAQEEYFGLLWKIAKK